MDELTQAMSMAIKKVAGNVQIMQTLTGTATNVRETLCDVEREGSPALLDCRFNAIDDDLQSFVTIVPKDGSNVIVGIIENLKTEAGVLRCSEVEKVMLKIGSQTLKIDKNGFAFNNGQEPVIFGLKAQTELNKMKTWIEGIITCLGTGTNGGGNVAFAGMPTLNAIPKPDFSQINNNKIMH